MSETIGPGSIIEIRECRDCGRKVAVKLNKRRIAYYFCNGQVAEDEVGCSHHERFSRVRTDKLVKAATLARTNAERAARQERADYEQQDRGLDTGGGSAAPQRASEGGDGPGGGEDTGEPGNGPSGHPGAGRVSFIDKILG